MKSHSLLNYIFIVILFFSSLSLSGQAKWEIQLQGSNPMKDNIHIGWFDIDNESMDDHELYHKSYGTGISIQHNYNSEYSFRLRTGISRTDILEINRIDKSYNHGKQSIFHFAPGWIYNIRMKRINGYFGFEGQFNIHSKFTSDLYYFGSYSRIEISGGFSTGIGALSGFQFPIGKIFFIGSEINPYLLYSSTGNNSRILDPGTKAVLSQTKDKDFGITRFGIRFSICVGIKIGQRKDVICPGEN